MAIKRTLNKLILLIAISSTFVFNNEVHAQKLYSSKQVSQNPLGISTKTLNLVGTVLPVIVGTVLTRYNPKNLKEFSDGLKKSLTALNLPAEATPLIDLITQQIVKFDDDTEKDNLLPDANDPNKPKIQEFLFPTLAVGCSTDGGISLSKALATAGPQKAPAPGPKVGEAGIVFTALGSGAALNNPKNPLSITWWNLNTFKTETNNLLPNPKINPEGPGTFTKILKTGKGKIISTIFGNVTTKNPNGKISSCTIIPTLGIFDV